MSSPYRILVTGSRDWSDRTAVHDALFEAAKGRADVVVVHGACPTGADAHALLPGGAAVTVRAARPLGWTGALRCQREAVPGVREGGWLR